MTSVFLFKQTSTATKLSFECIQCRKERHLQPMEHILNELQVLHSYPFFFTHANFVDHAGTVSDPQVVHNAGHRGQMTERCSPICNSF